MPWLSPPHWWVCGVIIVSLGLGRMSRFQRMQRESRSQPLNKQLSVISNARQWLQEGAQGHNRKAFSTLPTSPSFLL
jgi:hypothetical protein